MFFPGGIPLLCDSNKPAHCCAVRTYRPWCGHFEILTNHAQRKALQKETKTKTETTTRSDLLWVFLSRFPKVRFVFVAHGGHVVSALFRTYAKVVVGTAVFCRQVALFDDGIYYFDKYLLLIYTLN